MHRTRVTSFEHFLGYERDTSNEIATTAEIAKLDLIKPQHRSLARSLFVFGQCVS